MKNHTFAGVEVGCGDAQWITKLFEGFHFQDAVEEPHNAIIRGEAVAGNRPAGEGSKAAGVRDFFQLFERESAAVGCTDQRAHAGAGDEADWNAFFLEDL